MKDEEIEFAAMGHQTPFYVYDLDRLHTIAGAMRRKLPKQTGLCYAMKANPFVVKEMTKLVEHIEVCSFGEYQICMGNHIPPEKLIISGVLKKQGELEHILNECGARAVYTAESMTQYLDLVHWAQQMGVELSVFLRLTSGNQFGMDKDTVEAVLQLQVLHPFMHIQGLHYYSGTQKKNLRKIISELTELDQFMADLRKEYKVELPVLEYGPGLQIAYFKNTKKKDDEEECKLVTETIQRLQAHQKVVLEMGRVLTADCGYYFTSVLDTKENDGVSYAIVDGGSHQLHYDGQIKGMYQPYIRRFPKSKEGKLQEWTVCGSLCTVNDVLCQNMPARDLKKMDVLVFEKTGAYSAMEGMALFLSHELPEIKLYNRKDGWQTARRMQETYNWNTMEERNGQIIRNTK
ncbi:MAG: alanine racemase [Lachnospiraceae bacterium]|nr:alanine racemase [Lachnospiraceae bacterium]